MKIAASTPRLLEEAEQQLARARRHVRAAWRSIEEAKLLMLRLKRPE